MHARAAAEIRSANAGAYGEVPVGLEGKALDEAILFWSARVENEPNNIGARNTFGVLLVQKHQTRAAIEQWETSCIRRERRKYAEQPGMGARHHAQCLAPQRNSRGRIG